jgi:hypothetical protein
MRAFAVLLLIGVALASGATAAVADGPAASPTPTPTPVIDEQAIVEPTATATPGDATPTATPSATATAAPGAAPTPTPAAGSRATVIQPGYGNAATQPRTAKKREAARACVATRPPTSRMLAAFGAAGGRERGSFLPVGVAIVIAALVFALVAAGLRRRGADKPPPQGPLERFAAVLGALGVVATLLAQFVPGLTERPPPSATLQVKKVHARIERGDYARQMGADVKLDRLDAREVGNVVWLRIGLTGYKHQQLNVRYALYDLDPAASGALLPGTARIARLAAVARDDQRLLVPVWIGYPKSKRFRAEFWLVDGDGVVEMASTGAMHGSKFRYACEHAA